MVKKTAHWVIVGLVLAIASLYLTGCYATVGGPPPPGPPPPGPVAPPPPAPVPPPPP